MKTLNEKLTDITNEILILKSQLLMGIHAANALPEIREYITWLENHKLFIIDANMQKGA